MIDVRNIQVQKGQRTIVNGVSFRLQPGKITVLLGKNGAGKSTILETLSGKNPLLSGHIHWDGQPLANMNLQKLAQRRAVLSQKVNIAFPIQVSELVEMGSYVAQDPIPNAKLQTLVRHALREVEMEDFIHRNFNTLSGGEQKRVLLAKCIVQLNCCHWADMPKYLFLDEPTASLDIEQQYKLTELIQRFVRRRNIGVFAILHDINLAAQFADEILLLKDGQLLFGGSPREALTPDLLRESLDIQSIVQKHPVYDCPYVMTLPGSIPIAKEAI